MNRFLKLPQIGLLLIIISLVLSACRSGVPAATPETTAEAAATQVPTDTPAPTLTPTPQEPLAILLAAPGADPALVGTLQSKLTDYASQAGMRFKLQPELTPAELADRLQVVVVVPPDPGLQSLAAASPDVQFLAVGIPDLQPGDNLSVIQSQAATPDQVGFIAGYMAAVISPDWRTGMVVEGGTVSGKSFAQGFANGTVYLCGLCRPVYPPFPNTGYPLQVELPADSGPADWQSTVTYFEAWNVEAVFVDPAVAVSGLLKALADAEIQLIGADTPPAGVAAQWAATIGSSSSLDSLQAAWSDLLAGKGGQAYTAPLEILNTNPELLSPGRQRLVEALIPDLLSGYIGTGVDPATGESR